MTYIEQIYDEINLDDVIEKTFENLTRQISAIDIAKEYVYI